MLIAAASCKNGLYPLSLQVIVNRCKSGRHPVDRGVGLPASCTPHRGACAAAAEAPALPGMLGPRPPTGQKSWQHATLYLLMGTCCTPHTAVLPAEQRCRRRRSSADAM